ncbi:macrophage migration inhibitory factor [Cystoisospora suis]|uniref:L-dopachrome isomerase n=1 Tax=Cystoisospora suis TaxID=483139 RepID=A0A2C6KPG7_9APIC|nr:macrophage migration inhibitory factor [Cystoisospora suis]
MTLRRMPSSRTPKKSAVCPYTFSWEHWYAEGCVVILQFCMCPFGSALSDIIGKPVSYVMVSYVQSAHMRFGGSADPCAFIKVSSIGGLNASVNNKLAAALSAACNTHLGVKPSRVFSNFTNVPASEWGMGDRTFG